MSETRVSMQSGRTASGTVPSGTPLLEVPGRVPPTGHPFPTPAIVAFLSALNIAAMYGQAAFFRAEITNHNGWEDWIPAVGVALVIELIGVYLAGMAHASLMADQSAGMLRFGSYAIGVLIGTLNYWHFAGDFSIRFGATPTAITFGMLSAISPWLWAIYSRFIHRERLAELGQVDKRGVKLGINRKVWHPIDSVRVLSWAAWEGVTNPDEAVRGWELARELGDTAPVSPPPAGQKSAAEWVAEAEAVRAAQPNLSWDRVAGVVGCSTRHLRACRKSVQS